MLSYPEIGLKLILIILCISGLLYANSRNERMFSVPRPTAQNLREMGHNPRPIAKKDAVKETLIDLRAPKEKVASLNRWIRSASGVTHVDPILLVCLLHTESGFRKDAVSEKGYKGEAQTKRFSEFSSVNILEGAEILRDKLELSKGDMFEAVARYKGGKDNEEARDQATEVMRLYETQVKRRGSWK